MEETITCPHCGQMLADTCRVCVSCKQPVDPGMHDLAVAPAVAPQAEPELPPVRFSWPILFLTLAIAWLLAFLAAASFGVAVAQIIFGAATILSSTWILFDAQAKRIPKPWRWGAASLLLWIVFFPWYLSRRRTPRAACPFVEGAGSLLPRLLVALLVLQFLLALLVTMKQGPPTLP